MSFMLLLRPRLAALRNRWRRADRRKRRRALALGGLGLAFWIAIFVFFVRVLAYFRGVPELGPVLAERLLGMILLTFFSILLFSNVVTALSSFYLATDLPLLLAAPIRPERLHAARFVETLWDSSWMILLFGLPVFLAYGVVHGAGPAYYGVSLGVLLPLLVLSCALGISATMLLVRALPARSARDLFLLLAVAAAAVLYTFLRLLRPEQLLEPERFAEFLDFLAALQVPASPYLPTTWATDILMAWLVPAPGRAPGFHFLCLGSTAAAAVVACSMVAERTYAAGWSRAQEGRRTRGSRLSPLDRGLRRLPGLSPAARALISKDLKTFFRDATQWSQLLLLGALVVVYVYNFQVLPRVGGYRAQQVLQAALAFLNLSLAAFVVASIAVRFLFPSISLEGKSFWVLRSAPMPLRLLWWSKFGSHALPLFLLGTALVVLGNRVLGASLLATGASVATLLLLTLSVAALGLCIGSLWPRFDYEHAAMIPSSFGGVVYMILAVSLIGANVVLEAWPTYTVLLADFQTRALGASERVGIGLCAAAVVALDGAVFFLATRIGLRRLESLEPFS
jgi:ABC-2 type transport system permease protein